MQIKFNGMKLKLKNSWLMLFFIPALASAAGMGKINVRSALGEPLRAEIEVFVSDSNELDLAMARMGSQQDYTDAGLSDAYVAGINANIIKKSNGHYAIELQGNQAVNEPYLELLIKLDTKTSNLMRQYTVLLDPPMSALHEEFTPDAKSKVEDRVKKSNSKKYKQNHVTAEAGDEPTAMSEDAALAKTIVSAGPTVEATHEISTPKMHQAGNMKVTASDETYTTQVGDVFGKIAQRYQPVGVPLVKVMVAFYALNKGAFIAGDMHRLKVGSVIRIPDQESLSNAGHLKATHTPTKELPPMPNEPTKEALAPAKENQQEAKVPAHDILKAEPTPALDKNVSANSGKGDPNYVLKVSPGDTAGSVNQNQFQPEPAPDLAHASKDGQGQAVTGADAKNGSPSTAIYPLSPTTIKLSSKGDVDRNGLAAAANPDIRNAQASAHVSFADTLQQYWTAILMGLALLLAAAFGWLIYTKKRESSRDLASHFSPVFGQEILPVEPPLPEIATATSGLNPSAYAPPPDLPPQPLQTSSEQSASKDEIDRELGSQSAHMDIAPVDPLVEAELYMTYGRHKQAETILTTVLEDTPYKLELSLGLLKVYADRKDKASFERIVHSIHDDLSAGTIEDAMIWSKVVALGAKIDPENPLYGSVGKVDKLSASERALAAEKAMQDNLMPFEPDALMTNQVSPLEVLHEVANPQDVDSLDKNKPALEKEYVKESLFEDHADKTGLVTTPEKTNEIEFTLEDFKMTELSVKVPVDTQKSEKK